MCDPSDPVTFRPRATLVEDAAEAEADVEEPELEEAPSVEAPRDLPLRGALIVREVGPRRLSTDRPKFVIFFFILAHLLSLGDFYRLCLTVGIHTERTHEIV